MPEATGASPDDVALHAAARYVLETPNIAGSRDRPRDALHTVFDRLRTGWPEL
jgi:hypothetical protein